MRPKLSTLLLTLGFLISLPMAAAREHVILLHGLMRSKAAMAPMAEALTRAGYTVHNLDYPSRTAPIAQLADDAIGPALAECHAQGAEKIHFVTHSLGGILVRSYFSRHAPDATLGRVVMLGPPNQGSEVVDHLRDWWLFKKINGPAGQELGTEAASTPNRLGPANFTVGIIAGHRSINWINSGMIPGPDDGKVSVEHTKLAGMTDHIVLPVTHPFMARNRAVMARTLAFLRHGTFRG
ncbi:MAG: alpha/beta fold hydrolase [Verrucomicrobia bacterium]|nr:alpha/beta fold hydrolase [Verrucomicrobiota bacterium]